MKNSIPPGVSPPQWPAASYVQRPLTTAPTLDVIPDSHAASSPVGSPFGPLSYVHGPPNTQWWRGSPPSPSPFPGPSPGPVMYPSTDIVIPANTFVIGRHP